MAGIKGPVEKWQSFDQQTVTKTETAGAESVNHGASALANAKEAGKNALDTFDPTNHFRATWGNSYGGSNMAAAGIAQGLKVLMIPWDAALEVADLVAGPIKMVKNVGDAAIHGVMAGVNKLFG